MPEIEVLVPLSYANFATAINNGHAALQESIIDFIEGIQDPALKQALVNEEANPMKRQYKVEAKVMNNPNTMRQSTTDWAILHCLIKVSSGVKRLSYKATFLKST